LRIPASDELVIPSFSKENFLTHDHLEEIFNKHPRLFRFIPGQMKFDRVPKRILFTIIFQENQQLYTELKQIYNKIRSSRCVPSIKGCSVAVPLSMFNFISSLPDIQEEEIKKRSNFIKKSKRGSTISGIEVVVEKEDEEIV
jgi:hypothetical protein